MSTPYAFTVELGQPIGQAVETLRAALAAEQMGIVSEVDVQATLKAKLGVDTPAYRILGACNPRFAHRALSAEPDIGLLLPCNVIVRAESDGRTTIGFMDPAAILKLVENAEVHELAREVRAALERVRDSLH